MMLRTECVEILRSLFVKEGEGKVHGEEEE
jgi:hypothetical protein